VEITRIDEGFQQPQGMTETLRPIPWQPAFTQRQNARGQVRRAVLRQDQKAGVVGDQVQAVVLVAKIPADPAVTGSALPSRGANAQHPQPPLLPGGHIPEGLAYLGQRAEIVMGIQKRSKACFLARNHRAQNDLAKVQAQGLAATDVAVLYTRVCAK